MTQLPTLDITEYRYALYCRSENLGLPGSPHPIAVFRDERIAIAHGQLLWPTTYEVLDLQGGSPCGNRS